MKKKLMLTGIAAMVFLVIAAIILMCLFIPVHGRKNDNEYWSEYDAFDVNSVKTLEKSGENFSILQFTDLHYHLPHKTKETDNIVKTLVKENEPDMIVITGDSVCGPMTLHYTKHLTKLMDSFKIPWAIVYGNHDPEGRADKFKMGEIFENAEYCLYSNGPFNIGGTGNYAVNITENGTPFYSITLMDSNRVTYYNGDDEFGSFTPSQVTWYGWMTDGLKSAGYMNSLMFFHIPFPEFKTAYDEWEASGFDETMGSGEKFESVCSSQYNPGMFTKIKEKGATTHVFVGHDHVNNYSINYRDVVLTYGMKSSRQYYNRKEMVGGTLITIDSEKKVDIEMKYYDFQ